MQRRERRVIQYLRQRWRDSIGADVEEQTDKVSADLPYELQSKLFDQLATVSVAGAGLTVTLIGSLLRNAPSAIWLAVICFGLAAQFAVSGNIRLIDGLFRKKPTLQRSKIDVGVSVGLIGAALGILSLSAYEESRLPVGQSKMAAEASR